MPFLRKWSARTINVAGTRYELIVAGEANTSSLSIIPKLVKRTPVLDEDEPEPDPEILRLDIVHAASVIPELFIPIQFIEELQQADQYKAVEIYYNDCIIEKVIVHANSEIDE